MSKLDDLIKNLCPDGVEFKPIKSVYTRLHGTPITATKMKEIANNDGDIRIFAGGKTVINAFEKDIPKANITKIPAVLVQSRGIIDFVFYEKPFTFKNEMWAYTHKDNTSVKFLYYVLKKQLAEFGKYPVYQNSMIPLGYYGKYNCPANTTFVISAGAAGEIGYSYKDFWAADDCIYIECDKNLNSRFLYYFLLCQQKFFYSNVRRASVPRLSREIINKIKIPVPPIEEQERIVKILDRFDKLCNDISEGLPAEISARKKQYEYYRDKLLTFKERE